MVKLAGNPEAFARWENERFKKLLHVPLPNGARVGEALNKGVKLYYLSGTPSQVAETLRGLRTRKKSL
jgi:hypothetical protein